MSKFLTGTKIAILVANGFEQNDFTQSQRALLAAGATLKVISPDQGLVNGWEGSSWGHHFAVDQTLSTSLGADFDMLVIPGGERSLNKLKTTAHTKRLISSVMNANKPVVLFNDASSLLEHCGLPSEVGNLTNVVAATAEEHSAAVAAMVEFFSGAVAEVKQAA
ncbi:MAG: ThiJ/PfpI family protein [Micavibrio sp.]|nr:ThiJ/PfpI family protein [Micavibrio sp.]